MSYEDKLGCIREHINAEFDSSIIPTLVEYLKIDNQSPSYDNEERTNGKTEKAFKILIDWVNAAGLEGAEVVHLEEEGRTPFLLIDVKPTKGYENGKTALMYGHMDKQPPMDDIAPGWDEGLGPYKPVIRDGKLYGRGGADDGYAVFSSVASVRALQKHGLPHGHIVIIIEACEESGSYDLMHYIEKMKTRIGDVDLVICLDSGTLDYETMYATTALRGCSGGKLTVSLLKEGVHSGIGSGIIPDSFRVARMLLERIEDSATGVINVPEANCEIPAEVVKAMKYLDEEGKTLISSTMPVLPGVKFGASESELALRNTWKPTLTLTGMDGMPNCASAGNVLRKETSLALSFRFPPIVDPDLATQAIKKELTRDPPFGAKVTFDAEFSGPGWMAPKQTPWCTKLLNAASKAGYQRPLAVMAVGGSIPFMGMLGEMFPVAQFCITGILGPQSNAHGPNEFLHIEYTKNLTVGLTRLVMGHAVDPRD